MATNATEAGSGLKKQKPQRGESRQGFGNVIYLETNHMSKNTEAAANVQPEAKSPSAFIVLELGNYQGIIITADLGPFGNWREATTVAGDLEEEFPGSVRFVHRGGHGLVSALPIADQIGKARVELARLVKDRAAA